MTPPRVLTIAGSDPSGGAGLQADLKTFAAHGVYGMAVITALTAQSTVGVAAVHAPPAAFVAAQIDAVLEDCPPRSIKTGMLFDAEVVKAVAERLGRVPALDLVVDPVLVSTSGDRLLTADAEAALVERLVPLATLLTPNATEASVLTGVDVTDVESAEAAARALTARGARAVLVKGGHVPGDHAVDVLVDGDGAATRLSLPRLAIAPPHGAGCTLSAAIAAQLALGRPLHEAVRRAKAWVHAGLAASFSVGAGGVPVNHLVRPDGVS